MIYFAALARKRLATTWQHRVKLQQYYAILLGDLSRVVLDANYTGAARNSRSDGLYPVAGRLREPDGGGRAASIRGANATPAGE
jgi:hypothetical protein